MLQAVLTPTQAGLPALAWLPRSRDLLAGGFSGQQCGGLLGERSLKGGCTGAGRGSSPASPSGALQTRARVLCLEGGTGRGDTICTPRLIP